MARIVLCGYMVRYPMAGLFMADFHYVLGLARLGHSVAYVEEGGWPGACYDPAALSWGDDPQAGLAALTGMAARCGIDLPTWFIHLDGDVAGPGSRPALEAALREADLLLDLGGVCDRPELDLCRRRALVDFDPLFTQVGRFGGQLDRYTSHFSWGVNIGRPFCTVPTGGIDWLPTVPPVVVDLWPDTPAPADGAYTTVANWTAYGGVEHEGVRYGQKDEEFVRLLDLPRRTPAPLELALAGGGEEVEAMFRGAGWRLRDPGAVSSDVASYRAYIAGSRGELSAAKNAYVRTQCGWFSDRTVCYLASGRPAVLQDTGFSAWLPTGRGVLAFATVEEAAEALAAVEGDHAEHARAAREVAHAHFGHDVVLPALLERALG